MNTLATTGLAGPGFRVFISYSHEDANAFGAVAAALRGLGVNPCSDKDLVPGKGFTQGIQTDIAHAHVFLPILTPRSHVRGWVHQEIGYAVAMKVPCVPICIGSVDKGMIAMDQAVVLDEQLSGLAAMLSRVQFSHLVRESGREWVPPVGCAREPEERALMIERFSDDAVSRFGAMPVRMQSGLSSFTIPDEPPHHLAWRARYGTYQRTFHAYEVFRRERQSLERHAASAGLKMIINPNLDVDALYGQGVKHARLAVLVSFLESLDLPDDAVSVAFTKGQLRDHLLAVGDWFIAESLGDRVARGVNQTVFTTHAATISRMVAEFDRNLAGLLQMQGGNPGESRKWAIQQLREMMRDLPKHSE